jgi:hypothetical protein
MPITVKILADSINPAGDRITTGEWTYPRFIHSEVLTHRALAKNAASSRAIPISKMIQAVVENPAMPERWGKNQKGMQATTVLTGMRRYMARYLWLKARWFAVFFVWLLNKLGVHKQIANRLLEPWMHMTIIITGTEWNNFFALRAHPDAQPEFQVLAYRWLECYLNSYPEPLLWGEWHLPLTDDHEDPVLLDSVGLDRGVLKKVSVARCARVSYTKQDRRSAYMDDIMLHDRLQKSGHMSPFEHQAQAERVSFREQNVGEHSGFFGCFKGWKPYRKFLPNENRTNVDLRAILATKPDWITSKQTQRGLARPIDEGKGI